MFCSGLCLAGWPIFVWSESSYVQWRGARELERRVLELSHSAKAGSETIVVRDVPRESVSHKYPLGTPIALFKVPRLGLDWVVLEGTDDRTLDKSIGHIEGTALPGEEGNIAIAGHRNTHFRKLEEIRRGDEILLRGPHGDSRYLVEWKRVFRPKDTAVLDDKHGPALTLVTCYPFQYVGAAPLRYIVRALPK
jgi:LPXTG-site transpeptidase (sortase) family protein